MFKTIMLIVLGIAMIVLGSIPVIHKFEDKDKAIQILKEQYQVVVSQRDYYQNRFVENGFRFEAILPDGMSLVFTTYYQEDYPMSNHKEFAIKTTIRDALAHDERVF
jgi:hypothetical protein